MTTDDTPPLKPVTLESLLSDVRKVYNVQLNTFLTQFIQNTSEQQLTDFIGDDVNKMDDFIEQHVSVFVENEEPSVEEMVDGAAAIFVMAFLERLLDHLGIADVEDDDDGDDGDDDGVDGE